MNLTSWDTRAPLAAAFRGQWEELCARAPQANFTMDARFLEWESRHGRHARATILEAGERTALLVLRRTTRGWVSGYPWRWQAADVDPPKAEVLVPTLERCRAWFAAANALAGGDRLRCFLPVEPSGTPAIPAGRTLLVDLSGDDEKLLAGMDANKRRAIKKAAKSPWAVDAATSAEQYRAYFAIQAEVNTWRTHRDGAAVSSDAAPEPPPGESWREWELPWMRLFVVAAEGVVGGGSGFGFLPGGTIDYRTNAARSEPRKAGANAALAFAALRFGREQGCRIMNWGGVTEFKREMGGEEARLWCWLGGNPAWGVINQLEATGHRAVRAGRAAVKALRARSLAAKKKSEPGAPLPG